MKSIHYHLVLFLHCFLLLEKDVIHAAFVQSGRAEIVTDKRSVDRDQTSVPTDRMKRNAAAADAKKSLK
jgi:hypothetical protein